MDGPVKQILNGRSPFSRPPDSHRKDLAGRIRSKDRVGSLCLRDLGHRGNARSLACGEAEKVEPSEGIPIFFRFYNG